MKKILVSIGFLVFIGIGICFAETGVKKRRPLPFEYGRVVINNYSETSHMAPVVFDHWLHRAKFTCRLCHVDIGFAMQAGKTDIRAVDNINGYYCGTCHNDKMAFPACENTFAKRDDALCSRCHSAGKKIAPKYEFKEFTKDFPRERFGNGVDWEKAEMQGKIDPQDFIEGVSIKRDKLVVQKDFDLNAKVEGMPDIIFSHKKHTVWNGCELCHPEIFFGIKKGTTTYSMVDIYQGKYCGVCHLKVAFPLLDCQRCHTKQVR